MAKQAESVHMMLSQKSLIKTTLQPPMHATDTNAADVDDKTARQLERSKNAMRTALTWFEERTACRQSVDERPHRSFDIIVLAVRASETYRYLFKMAVDSPMIIARHGSCEVFDQYSLRER